MSSQKQLIQLSETYQTLFNNYKPEHDCCFDKDYLNSSDYKNFKDTALKHYQSPPSQTINPRLQNATSSPTLSEIDQMSPGPPAGAPGLSRSDTNIKLQNSSSQNSVPNNSFVQPTSNSRRSSLPVKSAKSNSSNSNQKSSKNSNKNSKRKKNKSNSKNSNNNHLSYDRKGAGDNKKHNIYQPPKK